MLIYLLDVVYLVTGLVEIFLYKNHALGIAFCVISVIDGIKTYKKDKDPK